MIKKCLVGKCVNSENIAVVDWYWFNKKVQLVVLLLLCYVMLFDISDIHSSTGKF